MQPRDFIQKMIEDHEGGLSLDPVDNGNWTGGKRNVGALVGSKYGVTPAALAKHRGISPSNITKQDISSLTIKEAVDIGASIYYMAPKIALLPWDRATASVLDMAWGAGPTMAIKLAQRMSHVIDDGIIGPNTINKYADMCETDRANEYAKLRYNYYDDIIRKNPSLGKFRNGWRNRTDSFKPGTKWWNQFYV